MESMDREGKVFIKPVIRKSQYFKDGHDGQFMYSGARTRVRLPYDIKTGRLAKVLTEEEQITLEKELGLNQGDLNTNKRTDNFWKEHKLDLDKEGKLLDLSDPIGYINYKLALIIPFIANSWEERVNSPEYSFAIVVDQADVVEESKTAQLNTKAYKYLASIMSSEKKLRNALRLLDKKPSPKATKESMLAELDKIIATKKGTRGVLTINDFINAMEDENRDLKIFIKDAMEIREVTKKGAIYSLKSGRPIGSSLEKAVEFFKDSENQEYKLMIEKSIKDNEK